MRRKPHCLRIWGREELRVEVKDEGERGLRQRMVDGSFPRLGENWSDGLLYLDKQYIGNQGLALCERGVKGPEGSLWFRAGHPLPASGTERLRQWSRQEEQPVLE